jgi:hypothetical protein
MLARYFKISMKNGEEYETTENTERFSVFSKELSFTGNSQ